MELKKLMAFGHVVVGFGNGDVRSYRDAFGISEDAPDVRETETRGFPALEIAAPAAGEWEPLDGFSGPVMHSAELIGGALAQFIENEPGVYVAVVVESGPVGWAVLRRDLTCSDGCDCGDRECPECCPADDLTVAELAAALDVSIDDVSEIVTGTDPAITVGWFANANSGRAFAEEAVTPTGRADIAAHVATVSGLDWTALAAETLERPAAALQAGYEAGTVTCRRDADEIAFTVDADEIAFTVDALGDPGDDGRTS